MGQVTPALSKRVVETATKPRHEVGSGIIRPQQPAIHHAASTLFRKPAGWPLENQHCTCGVCRGNAGFQASDIRVAEITKPLYDRSRYYLGREEADVAVKFDFEGKILVSVRRRHADSVARFVMHLTTQCQEFMDDG